MKEHFLALPALGMLVELARLVAWRILKAYGEVAWCAHGGACAGYYWALRACCNWCGRNWYGEQCGKVFNSVGRIEW